MKEQWSVGEVVGSKVAVRDENAILVGWVLAQDAAMVAAAPAMLGLMRDLVGVADDCPALAQCEALSLARALVDELSQERDVCAACEGSRCEEHGDPCPTCEGRGLVTVTEDAKSA